MYVRTVQRDAVTDPPPTVEELRFQRCTWCSTVVFSTCLLCPVCSSTDLRWERSPGSGKVCSTVEVRRKGQRPRTVAVVELRDGVRLRCELEGAPTGVPAYGAQVRAVEIATNGRCSAWTR